MAPVTLRPRRRRGRPAAESGARRAHARRRPARVDVRRDRHRRRHRRRAPGRPRPAARRRRAHAGRQPVRVGAGDGRLLPARARRPALHRAAAPKDLALRLRVARPRLVVCDERNADVLAAAGWDGPTLWVPWGELPAAPAPPHAELEPADPCLITFTSGTAGEPKAVLHGQRYLPARCCRRGTGSTRGRTTWCGAPPRPAGRSRPATRSSRRGCAAPPRSCTTRASTPTSGSSCSSASASTCSAWRRPSTA